jgi:hypothetical protein
MLEPQPLDLYFLLHSLASHPRAPLWTLFALHTLDVVFSTRAMVAVTFVPRCTSDLATLFWLAVAGLCTSTPFLKLNFFSLLHPGFPLCSSAVHGPLYNRAIHIALRRLSHRAAYTRPTGVLALSGAFRHRA